MSCSAVVGKSLNTLEASNVGTYLSKETLLLLKKGRNAFPMENRSEAATFDSDVRTWLLDLCKADADFPPMRPVEESLAQRNAISAALDALVSDYKRLLLSVAKASQNIPNPVFSTLFSSIGVTKQENQYYNQVHDALHTVQQGYASRLKSLVDRIDRRLANQQAAELQRQRAEATAAAAAARQRETNAQAAKVGLPPGSKPETVLAARLAALRRGGGRKKKTHRVKKALRGRTRRH